MIPDYQSLMRPVLESVINEPRKISDVVDEVSTKFGLTTDERQQLLPSGKQTTIANRTHWAKSYLKQAGLVRSVKRGWFEITENGKNALKEESTRIDNTYLAQFDAFQEFKSKKNDSEETAVISETDVGHTPDEDLLSAHQKLQETLGANLLEAVRQASPKFFEALIVDLFVAMGYGGSVENAGRRLGQSGDNGVDGVIDQDSLGLDQIFLQAKRYGAKSTVGSGEIRDFFGALNVAKATKGVFVTTSSFSPSAIQTVRDLGSRIVTVDGAQLARLMIKYNIGCRDKDILHIKEIDEAFFDEFES